MRNKVRNNLKYLFKNSKS